MAGFKRSRGVETTVPAPPHHTAAMAVPRSRIVDLMKVKFPATQPDPCASAHEIQVQCGIFSTIFNPTGERLGNKILRQRLRGPALAAYYPRRVATFRDLQRLYPGYEMYNELEEDRLEHLQIAKSRGKGAPKKKRTAAGMDMREMQAIAWRRSQLLTAVHREQEVQQQEEEMIASWDLKQAFVAWSFGIHCAKSWYCTLWPRGYPGYERRHLQPLWRQTCMYIIFFTLHPVLCNSKSSLLPKMDQDCEHDT